MYFRYGLREILLGNHPDAPSWVVSKNHPVLYRGGQPRELGPLPPRWEPWPIDEQHRLGQVLIGADISNIAVSSTYPDWLGYLGLGLKYSEDAERETRAVTKSWVPQLMKLRGHNVRAYDMLQAVQDSDDGVLSWRNLELLE